jgi:hypothetical protein
MSVNPQPLVIKYQKISHISGEKLLIMMFYEHVVYSANNIIELLELDDETSARILEHIKNRAIVFIKTYKFKELHNILINKAKHGSIV